MIAIFNNRSHSTRVQKNIELMDLRILGNLCKLVSLCMMVIMHVTLIVMERIPSLEIMLEPLIRLRAIPLSAITRDQ